MNRRSWTGCGNLRFYRKILMPLTKSAMGSNGGLHLYQCMEYAWFGRCWSPVRTASVTGQIGISMLNSVDAQSITLMLAGVVMIIIPSISIFIIGQKALIKGMFSRSSQVLIPVTEKRIENCNKTRRKNEEKVIASILAASMAAMALTGCGGGKTTSEAQSATTDETIASAEAGSTADGAEAPDLGNQDTEGTTITFWHSMAVSMARQWIILSINCEENTDGITVEAVYQGEYDDTINKLKSAQIGNMGADLVQIYDIGTRFA